MSGNYNRIWFLTPFFVHLLLPEERSRHDVASANRWSIVRVGIGEYSQRFHGSLMARFDEETVHSQTNVAMLHRGFFAVCGENQASHRWGPNECHKAWT